MLKLNRVNLITGETRPMLVADEAIATVTEHEYRPGEAFYRKGAIVSLMDGTNFIVRETCDHILNQLGKTH